jgi:hypothetical protein
MLLMHWHKTPFSRDSDFGGIGEAAGGARLRLTARLALTLRSSPSSYVKVRTLGWTGVNLGGKEVLCRSKKSVSAHDRVSLHFVRADLGGLPGVGRSSTSTFTTTMFCFVLVLLYRHCFERPFDLGRTLMVICCTISKLLIRLQGCTPPMVHKTVERLTGMWHAAKSLRLQLAVGKTCSFIKQV